MKKVRWGIISTARHGWEKVIPSMMKSPNVEVLAISSRNEEKAKHWAKELGIPRAYGSYEAMLADPDIEVVYNMLPNHLHVSMTLAAAKAGKHVLCEKPIAMNAAEAEQLRAVPKGIHVAEAFMLRHHPQWKEVNRHLDAGDLGEVRAVQSFQAFYLVDPDNVRNRPEVGGGATLDLGCYAAAVSRYIYKSEPRRVMSLLDYDPELKVDRLAAGIIDFGGGRTMNFVVSTQLAPYERVNICGTNGRIEIMTPYGTELGQPTKILIDTIPEGGRTYKGRPRWDVLADAKMTTIEPCDQYQLQVEAFGRVVRGEEPPVAGIEDSIRNMRVVDAMFRSSETGQWVDIAK